MNDLAITMPEPTPAPTTADLLAAARADHAAAIETHRGLVAAASKATAAHDRAVADRQRLLDAAATGAAASPEDMSAARASMTEAQDQKEIAASVAAGATTRAERAHVKVLHAEARHLRATWDAALADRIAKAEAADAAWATLQMAIGAFNDTTVALSIAANARRLHDAGLAEHGTRNATLRTLPDGDQPKAGTPHTPAMRPLKVAYITTASGELAEEKFTSLAERERSTFGLPAPDQATRDKIAHANAAARRAADENVAGMRAGQPYWQPTEWAGWTPRQGWER